MQTPLSSFVCLISTKRVEFYSPRWLVRVFQFEALWKPSRNSKLFKLAAFSRLFSTWN